MTFRPNGSIAGMNGRPMFPMADQPDKRYAVNVRTVIEITL